MDPTRLEGLKKLAEGKFVHDLPEWEGIDFEAFEKEFEKVCKSFEKKSYAGTGYKDSRGNPYEAEDYEAEWTLTEFEGFSYYESGNQRYIYVNFDNRFTVNGQNEDDSDFVGSDASEEAEEDLEKDFKKLMAPVITKYFPKAELNRKPLNFMELEIRVA